jgi:hypothetical protein
VDTRDPGEARRSLQDSPTAGQTRVVVIGRLHANQGIKRAGSQWHSKKYSISPSQSEDSSEKAA